MEKQFIVADVKAQDDGKIVAIASTGSEDREGEVLDQTGWDLKQFKKNPVILWAHSPSNAPIGRADKVWVEGVGKKAKLMVKATLHELTDLAKDIKALVKEGIVNTLSVGFMPMEQDGNIFTKSELLEISFVPVPANPEATVMSKSLGLKTMDEIFKKEEPKEETVEEVVEEDEKDPVTREEFEQLKTEIANLSVDTDDEVESIKAKVGQLTKEVRQVGRVENANNVSRQQRKALQIASKSIEYLLRKK